jgi:putative CocE/NonD family hydrolase
MKKTTWKIVLPILAALVLLVLFVGTRQRKTGNQKISEFGRYQGYSPAIYDGYVRTSDFLRLSDGTRLAYDLFLPTKKGVPANQPLPVLFKYTPYDRAWTLWGKDGHNNLCYLNPGWFCDPALRVRAFIMNLKGPRGSGLIKDALNRTEWLVEMVHSGYAVIVVDRPGTGASFGQLQADPLVAAGEADEIINWIAAQPWSDGKVGMFGDSIQAQIQFRAASAGNPHLKAILPATTWMDNYSAVAFPGGIQDLAFSNFYITANKAFDLMATPVDQDKDGSLLAQARLERNNTSALAESVAGFKSIAYRDSLGSYGENVWGSYSTLYPLLDKINRSGTAVYLINGWYDIYARDNFLIYKNLTVPKRLLVRPTDHAGIESPGSDINYAAEAHRWFDYWLKGIDNGIMGEPPIHYYLQDGDKAQAWQSTDTWPLPDQKTTDYYFGSAGSGGRVSANSGRLDPVAPTDSRAFDAYQVDYSLTTGKNPLWSGLAMPHKYPNLQVHDSKALTYTGPSLEKPVNIVGHPILHVWLSTNAPDLDVFAYLEQVDGKGNSTYITEGELRASHRQLSAAPFDNFGLPWRDHFQSGLQPIPAGEPMELVFDLRPTAWQFQPGSSLRITIAFADAGNFDTPVLQPAPQLQVLREAGHPSFVELPVVTYP